MAVERPGAIDPHPSGLEQSERRPETAFLLRDAKPGTLSGWPAAEKSRRWPLRGQDRARSARPSARPATSGLRLGVAFASGGNDDRRRRSASPHADHRSPRPPDRSPASRSRAPRTTRTPAPSRICSGLMSSSACQAVDAESGDITTAHRVIQTPPTTTLTRLGQDDAAAAGRPGCNPLRCRRRQKRRELTSPRSAGAPLPRAARRGVEASRRAARRFGVDVENL